MNKKYKSCSERAAIYRTRATLFLLFLLLLPQVCTAAMSVTDTKHNLSVTGPGAIKALSEGEVCVFCHTPHKARSIGLLWNRQDSTAVYTPYQSTTIQNVPGQPTGHSRLCLSCHDGTIALGALQSRAVDVDMTQQFLNIGPSGLDIDLSDDHPVSFVYDSTLSSSNPEYRDPSLLMDEVLLDDNNELQCTSCHDPHDDTNGKFLRIYNSFSALCLQCHQPSGWLTSSHKLSSALWDSTPPDPWPHTEWITVDNNACENCHRPHGALGHQRILNEANEEDNCFPCHNGNVAALDMESEFSKISFHPVSSTVGVHDPEEDILTAPRHVECADCHNPHQVRNLAAAAPNVSGALAGVSGINNLGNPVENAAYEYEICLKCHGDSAQGTAPVPRQILSLNKLLQFDVTNPSFHPVQGPRLNPDVPSLLPQYNSSSVIYCMDCHNNDNGPGAGGLGPNGPHGSQNPYLLERAYVMADFTAESPANYALCYKCHDRTSILSDVSFSAHNLHIVAQSTPCSVCHDPHGISNAQGNAVNNSNLINFDTSVVFPDTVNSRLEFIDGGQFTGQCFLRCHTTEHAPKTY